MELGVGSRLGETSRSGSIAGVRAGAGGRGKILIWRDYKVYKEPGGMKRRLAQLRKYEAGKDGRFAPGPAIAGKAGKCDPSSPLDYTRPHILPKACLAYGATAREAPLSTTHTYTRYAHPISIQKCEVYVC